MSAACSESVPTWRKLLLAYKEDLSKPNPFKEPDPGMSIHTTCAVSSRYIFRIFQTFSTLIIPTFNSLFTMFHAHFLMIPTSYMANFLI
jgi:hypothetical protein